MDTVECRDDTSDNTLRLSTNKSVHSLQLNNSKTLTMIQQQTLAFALEKASIVFTPDKKSKKKGTTSEREVKRGEMWFWVVRLPFLSKKKTSVAVQEITVWWFTQCFCVLKPVNKIIFTTSRVVSMIYHRPMGDFMIIVLLVKTTDPHHWAQGRFLLDNDNINYMKTIQRFNRYTISNFIMAHHIKKSKHMPKKLQVREIPTQQTLSSQFHCHQQKVTFQQTKESWMAKDELEGQVHN